MGTAYRADVTVTFGMNKAGLVLYPGREYAGQVRVCQIGFSNKVTEEEEYSYFTYNRQDLSRIPARKANTHKGSYGKLSVIAGSRYMSGAACLAAEAAYRTGCVMVKVYTHEANRTIVGTKIPEALMMTYSSSLDVDDIIRDAMEFGDVVLIGPGLGTDETAVALVKKLLCSSNIPVIIDADGLNILAKDMNMLSGHKADVVLTPHVKEMSVLTGHSIDEIKADLPNQARLLAEKYNITCVLKDAATCVSSGGFPVYINTSGNNGMATAGSGDVLAGIISGLIAMKADVPEAARLGVYIHGLAGDYACHTKSAYSMLAGDIIDNINKVFGGGK
jgi:NAD(P)H-hydrate epimerase